MTATNIQANNKIIAEYAIWSHNTSGEKWAVALNGEGAVVACCGPLDYSEYTTTHPSDFNLDSEDADWMMENIEYFGLYEGGVYRAV